MKTRVLSIFMILVMLFTLTPNLSVQASTTKRRAVVSISTTAKKLECKKTLQLSVKKAKGVVIKSKTFSTSNKKIATVSKAGKITTKTVGTAIINTKVKYTYKKKIYTKTLKTKITVTKCKRHKYGKAVVKKSTCKAQGTKTYTCRICGAKKVVKTAKAQHTWGTPVITKQPTCTNTGIKTYTCTVCKVTKAVSIPKTAHKYSDYKITKQPTCVDSGKQQTVCSVCGDTKIIEVAPLGHDFETEYTTDIAPTCEVSGTKSYHCKRCNAHKDSVSITALGHSWGTWVTTTQPTCTETGVKTATCTVCGKAKTETVNPTGHKYSSSYTTDIAPTCLKDGSKSRHCTVCGAKTDVTVIKATGHKYEKTSGTYAPTCIKDGMTYYKCRICSATKSEVIPKTGKHKYDKSKVIKAATCTETGISRKTCIVCGYQSDEEIPKINHDWQELTARRTEPTCTSVGSATYSCSMCHQTKTEKLPQLAHKYDWVTIKAPTFWKEGSKIKTCSVCGLTDDTSITLLDSVKEIDITEQISLSYYGDGYRDVYNIDQPISSSDAKYSYFETKTTDTLKESARIGVDIVDADNAHVYFSIQMQDNVNYIIADYKGTKYKFNIDDYTMFKGILDDPAVTSRYKSSVIADLKSKRDKVWGYKILYKGKGYEKYTRYVDVYFLGAIATYIGANVKGYSPNSYTPHNDDIYNKDKHYMECYKIVS